MKQQNQTAKHPSYLPLFICFLILSHTFKPVSAYTVTTYTIEDLETNSGTTAFANEVADWSFPNYASTRTNDCANSFILGGPYSLGTSSTQNGYSFSRTYTDLVSHTGIYLTMTIWLAVKWNEWNWYNDRISITMDGGAGSVAYFWGLDEPTWNPIFNYYSWPSTSDCNGNWFYNNLRIFAKVPHADNTVRLTFTSQITRSTSYASFGVRDIKMTFTQQASVSSYNCVKYSWGSMTSGMTQCNWAEGRYGYGIFESCDSTCSSCWGPNPNQCFSCRDASNVIFDGMKCLECDISCSSCYGPSSKQCKTCASSRYYLSWTNECVTQNDCPWPMTASGGLCSPPSSCTTRHQFITQDGTTCLNECPSPNIIITRRDFIKICIFPCNNVEYLYWDGTCQQECPSPLEITTGLNNGKVCNFNCDPSQYLYWDGTCGPTCNSPYIPRTQNDRMFCMPPCPSTQSLYSDNTCIDTCSTGLTSVTIGGVPRCVYPCQDSEYLDWDTNCRTTCDFPLTTRVEHGKKYCDYPTDPNNYLYWDGTSNANCISPLSPRTDSTGLKYCDYLCNSWEFLYEDGSCVDECLYPLTSRVTNSRQFCDYSCTGTNSLDWDGNCVPSCNFPLSPRTQYTKDFCDYSCGPTQYLYADGTCSDTCAKYYTTSTSGTTVVKQFCNYPCTTSPDVILWEDGSCNPACDPPLLTSYQYGDPYCSFPCDNGKYYLYDGTCTSTCDSPFLPVIPVVNGMERYCNFPCADNTDFYYYNGTCHDSCVEPLKSSTLNGVKWCVYPCLIDQYLYPNGSCAETCELPLISQEISTKFKTCSNPCPVSEYLDYNGVCQSDCQHPYRPQTSESIGNICWQPCDNPMHYYSVADGICREECPTPAQDKSEKYLTP